MRAIEDLMSSPERQESAGFEKHLRFWFLKERRNSQTLSPNHILWRGTRIPQDQIGLQFDSLLRRNAFQSGE